MTNFHADVKGYAQGYHDSVVRSHASRTVSNSAAFLLPQLKSDMRILDVGCGPGTITCDLAQVVNYGNVVGIDISSKVLDQAQEAAKSRGLINVTFETVDILNGLSYADGFFDVVYCHQTLLHLSKPVKALQEMKRVCKVGGLVAAREGDWQSLHFYPSNEGLELFQKIFAKVYRIGGGSDMAGRKLQSWAREAGFVPHAVRKSATAISYSSSEEREWWASLNMERIEKSDLRPKAVSVGATEEDFALMLKGWQEWKDHIDGCWTMLQGEILCRR